MLGHVFIGFLELRLSCTDRAGQYIWMPLPSRSDVSAWLKLYQDVEPASDCAGTCTLLISARRF